VVMNHATVELYEATGCKGTLCVLATALAPQICAPQATAEVNASQKLKAITSSCCSAKMTVAQIIHIDAEAQAQGFF
jgi:hypothetical protein